MEGVAITKVPQSRKDNPPSWKKCKAGWRGRMERMRPQGTEGAMGLELRLARGRNIMSVRCRLFCGNFSEISGIFSIHS